MHTGQNLIKLFQSAPVSKGVVCASAKSWFNRVMARWGSRAEVSTIILWQQEERDGTKAQGVTAKMETSLG